MTLDVVIRRLGTGLLEARVLQAGQYGRNLLTGRSISNAETAKGVTRGVLMNELFKIGDVEIVWHLIV